MKKYLPIMVVLLTAASLSGCRKGVEHAWLDEAEAFVATTKADSADEPPGCNRTQEIQYGICQRGQLAKG